MDTFAMDASDNVTDRKTSIIPGLRVKVLHTILYIMLLFITGQPVCFLCARLQHCCAQQTDAQLTVLSWLKQQQEV